MPAPDPEGLYLEEYEDGSISVISEIWEHGNRRHRLARAKRVLRNLRWDWRCSWCREDIPLHKRADARFCSERCRKAKARQRRSLLPSSAALHRPFRSRDASRRLRLWGNFCG